MIYKPIFQISLRIHRPRHGVIKGIALAELVVIVFRFVALLEVLVVVRKEVVVILWADYLGLQLLFDVFVGVEVGCLVLAELVVVVFVVEVLGTDVGVLGQGVSELFYDLLEASPRLARVFFLEGSVGVDLEEFYLLVDVVHCALEVALLAVGGEIEGLEGRKGTH